MMDRRAGSGPFTAGTYDVHTIASGYDTEGAVFDCQAGVFALVSPGDCHGLDLAAARARAQRIAEALNRNDALKAVLVKARAIIQSERDTTVECATIPPAHDIAELDDQTRPFVEAFDQALAEIDEALR